MEDSRINAGNILKHPWFKDMDENIQIFNDGEKQYIKSEYIFKEGNDES